MVTRTHLSFTLQVNFLCCFSRFGFSPGVANIELLQFLKTKTKPTIAITHGLRFCGCVTTSMVAALYTPDIAEGPCVLSVLSVLSMLNVLNVLSVLSVLVS
jgi:hypothetical protein